MPKDPEDFIIRRCDGNKDCYGIFRRDWNPSNYGWCVGTSYSLDSLVNLLAPFPDCKIELQP